jgi:hypothetical protein
MSGGEADRIRLRRRYLWSGYRPEPLPSHRGPVEPPSAGKIGICCSGGGIRSAAFNLGALQSLQRSKELQEATYLAAVSGGSYIAAAFAMVGRTWRAGKDIDKSEIDNSDPELFENSDRDPFAPGSPEEQYLRNRCDYLAPDGMAKLYLGWRVTLGLVFNILFLALPLFGATMVLGATVYQKAFPSLVPGMDEKCIEMTEHACHSGGLLPLWSWLTPASLAGLSALLALLGMAWRIHHDVRRRAVEVWATRLLVAAVVVGLLTVALPELVSLLRHSTESSEKASTNTTSVLAPITGGSIAALLAALSAHLRSIFSEVGEDAKKFKALSPKLQRAFAYAVAAIIGPLLFYAVIVFSMSLTLANADSVVHRERLVAGGAAGVVLFSLLYLTIDISALSLHHFYKRRLCSAFALKRVKPRPTDAPVPGSVAEDELPHRAADTQQMEDGIAMERDYDKLTLLSKTRIKDKPWPTLLVCAAANISDPGATPPGRRVTSFTFSPYSIGGPLVGAMPTESYEDAFADNRSRARDLTLPAAVAMSGAAIAPSMGKLTRRPLTFLLALGNVRLGVWVPNPRWVASGASWIRWQPPRPSYLLRELFGRNRADGRYLFVTDGGHYENLGLVELLRRGCTKIYCFDASGGESFSELGEAVALARSELGVEIEIDPTALLRGAKAVAPANGAESEQASTTPQRVVPCDPCATNQTSSPDDSDMALKSVVCGRFRYRPEVGSEKGVEGVIYYARNVMTHKVPWDVRARHLEDPTFPHDPTIDQLYTDQKFESYRMLGEQAGEDALALAAVVQP